MVEVSSGKVTAMALGSVADDPFARICPRIAVNFALGPITDRIATSIAFERGKQALYGGNLG